MNAADIKRLFPNASASLLAANSEVSDAKPQRDKAPALGAAVPGKAKSLPRITVRLTGYRVRPLDPDNFAGGCKDIIDGLRHAQLIPGDEPWRIRLETDQEKVRRYSEEKTVVEIIR